jgi:hypothetical protein
VNPDATVTVMLCAGTLPGVEQMVDDSPGLHANSTLELGLVMVMGTAPSAGPESEMFWVVSRPLATVAVNGLIEAC